MESGCTDTSLITNPRKKPFTIALIQLKVVVSNKPENIERAVSKVEEAAFRGAQIIALPVGSNKPDNMERAVRKVEEAASHGAHIIVLPECFNSPYGSQYFDDYAESIPGPTSDKLCATAKRLGIMIVGGSIPERDEDNRLYNTCAVIGSNGEIIAKYRKTHLVDIDIPGKVSFKESDLLTHGQELVIIDTVFCKIGIEICFDIRFPEVAARYAQSGCDMIICPACFNASTGPLHWDVIARSTSIANQVFTVMCSPARDTSAFYVAYGHSLVVDPWGSILVEADEVETIVYTLIDPAKKLEIEKRLPLMPKKRPGLYEKEPNAYKA